jgi:hypothetical protein
MCKERLPAELREAEQEGNRSTGYPFINKGRIKGFLKRPSSKKAGKYSTRAEVG